MSQMQGFVISPPQPHLGAPSATYQVISPPQTQLAMVAQHGAMPQGAAAPGQQMVMVQNPAVAAAGMSTTPASEKSGRACRHFQRGRCTWGEQCRFAHRIDPELQAQENAAAAAAAAQQQAGHHHSQQPTPQQGPISPNVPGLVGTTSPSSGSINLTLSPTGQQPIIPPHQAVPPVMIQHHTQPSSNQQTPQQIPVAPVAQPAATQAVASTPDALAAAALQQAQLQLQRHAILKAAINGTFALTNSPSGTPGRAIISIQSPPINDITFELFSADKIKEELVRLENDANLNEGGLHYLIGEPSLFWSMMVELHGERKSVGHPKWDALISAAKNGMVECMFHRSKAGCLNGISCPFHHKSVLEMQAPAPLATFNAAAFQNTALGQRDGVSAISNGTSLQPAPFSLQQTTSGNTSGNSSPNTTSTRISGMVQPMAAGAVHTQPATDNFSLSPGSRSTDALTALPGAPTSAAPQRMGSGNGEQWTSLLSGTQPKTTSIW